MLLTATMLAFLLPMAQNTGTRTVTVTFVNHLDGRTLFVTTPEGTTPLGSFEYGGKLSVSIASPSPGTSVKVSWKAGNQKGNFTITSDTADYLRTDLKNGGPVGP
jgi:hypothetical protein